MALTPGHQGPNLKRLSPRQDRVPAWEVAGSKQGKLTGKPG